MGYAIGRTMQPRIIPRKEHRVSRKQVSPNALRTLYRLRDQGFMAYLVGGCVRDLLLERTPKDFDIATDATPGEIKRLFRNCRLVGRRFRLAHLHFQDEILEVSTFRAAAPSVEEEDQEEDSPHGPPRHLKNDDGMVLRDNVFGTPEEDALRRDFTINALAYNIADFSVIDYTTGLVDLEERLLRTIGDPALRFTEDPVRMIRAVRFAASHDFVIEPAAWDTLCALSATISRASPARLYEEILKLFLKGSARRVLPLLEGSGLLEALFPDLFRWLQGNHRGRAMLLAGLEGLDEQVHRGSPLSPALFLAAVFGPMLEEAVLLRSRDGIPHLQALHEACALFLEGFCRVVTIPGRVGSQLRGILAAQPALHRMPPRRPAAVARRLEFPEALTYLRLKVETNQGDGKVLAWWDAFLSGGPTPVTAESPVDSAPAKRRKRKRKRRRRPNSPSGMPDVPVLQEIPEG